MTIYGNKADLIAYQAARGVTVADDVATDQSLQRASDYIRTRYAIRLGSDADDANVIEATYIAAGYDLTTPGFWQKTYTPGQAKVLTEVNGIKWQVVKDDRPGTARGSDAQLPVSPAIDALFPGANYSGAALLVV